MTATAQERKDLLRYLVAEVQAGRLDAVRAKAFIGGLDPTPEPVAIIGMACRFPDAEDYGSFWENLKRGRQSIRAFPQHRADDYARMAGHGEEFREGGYLERIDLFDADYFGVPPRVAQAMDPYHRNLLEVLVEAMEDAGYCRSQIEGTRTGIFVGNDHTHRQVISYLPFVASTDFSTIVGSWTGMLASRLAYHFDLSGPAQVIDTGCSSALVALDAAMSALANGDCDAAFVAGANLFLCPTSIGHETESHEARVRAFDARANGTVWSEGVAGLLVKPLARALADGDPIHSVVLGTATNNDGRTNGITAPNAQAQKDVIVRAWNRARLSPAAMGYLEAHGTGTRLGDPIEILGLTKAFAPFTDRKQFCAMGSVKSNIGHTVGVAGLASLIKASLCLENAQIPPTVHFDSPNPLLDVASSPVFVNDRLMAWDEDGLPRRAGVSSFSLSGTNSHVVLEEAPRRDDRPPLAPGEHVLPLSAHDEDDLRVAAERLHDHLLARPELRLDDVCHTQQVARDHRGHRAIVVASDLDGLLAALRSLAGLGGQDADPDGAVRILRPGDRTDGMRLGAEMAAAAGEFLAGEGRPFDAVGKASAARRVSLPGQVMRRVRHWGDRESAEVEVAGAVAPVVGVSWRQALTDASRLADEPDPSPARRLIAWLWSEELGYPTISGGDSFFSLGGDSLASLKIGQALNDLAGLAIPPGTILEHPVFDDFVTTLRTHHGFSDDLVRARGVAGGDRPAPPAPPGTTAYELPLTPAQRDVYAAMLVDQDSLAYNVTGLTLSTDGIPDGLDEAVAALVRRHDALRTTFHERHRRLVQVIHPHMEVTVEHHDLGALAAGQTHEARAREAMADFVRPFQLDQGPLIRVGCFRFEDGVTCLAIDVHHLVTDGSSMGVLVHELDVLLNGDVLPPLARPYRSVVTDVLRRLNEVDLAPHEDYWANVFADGVPRLDLPTDRPRAGVAAGPGATASALVEPALLARAKQYASERGLTLFMVLFGVLHQVLARASGQADLVIGTPVVGRADARDHEHIGMFVNTLPIRMTAERGVTVGAFNAAVRDAVLGGFAHQGLPLDRIVAALDVTRRPDRRPLFDVCYAHQNIDMGLDLEEGTTWVPFDDATAKYDITVTTREAAEGLHLDWEYATGIFDEATVARHIERFRHFLGSLVVAPDDVELASLDLVPPDEMDLLERCGRGPEPALPIRGIVELFQEKVAGDPDRTALVHGADRLSYGALDARSDQVAHALAAHGVAPGDRVALLFDRGFDLVAAVLGSLKAGAVYVPLSTAFPTERLALMVADAGARVVLTSRARTAQASELAPDDVPVLLVDGPCTADTSPFPIRRAQGDVPVYVMYTSGTTGKPKGVTISSRGVLRVAHGASFADADADDVFLMLSDYSFDGSTYDMYTALTNGATLVLVDRDDVLELDRLAGTIVGCGVTRFFITSSLFNALVDHAPGCLAGVRRVIVGGEALSAAHVGRAHALLGPGRLANGYGPTETTVFATVHVFDSFDPGAPIPIGRPIGDTVLRVLDEEGRPVPLGTRGELYIGGGGVGAGYLNRPDLTAERFVRSPAFPGEVLYRTGDLVSFGADGLVRYHGRLDHQVKLRGYRIELGEITRAAVDQAGLRWAHCALVGEPGGQSLCLWVQPEEGGALDEQAIRAALARRLPDFMVPTFIQQVDRVPLNKNGKVDEEALPRPGVRATGGVCALTEPQRVVAQAWAEVLGAEVDDPDASFYALGGDSIKAIQIVARLRSAGHQVQVGDLLERPSVRALSDLLTGGTTVEPGARDDAVVTGPVGATPIQRSFLAAQADITRTYTQALLVTLPERVEADRLGRALHRVSVHHDLLRLRLGRTGELVIREPEGSLVHCEEAVDPTGGQAYLETVQRRIDLADGPVLVAATGLGESRRSFFIAAHHLVVDVVSWGIILEDLVACLADEEVVLPPKTLSFPAWSAALTDHARQGGFRGELAYWRGVATRAAEAGDLFPREPLTRRQTEQEELVLDGARAGRLFDRARTLWNLSPADTLLAILAQALAAGRDRSDVLVALEGHGREQFGSGSDIVRTVGWFTSVYPQVVAVGSEIADTLASVREAGTHLPAKGFGFGPLRWLDPGLGPDGDLLAAVAPQVGFNYLGDLGGPRDGVGVEFLPAETTVDGDHPTDIVLDVIGFRRDADVILQIRAPRAWSNDGTRSALHRAVLDAFDAACAQTDGAGRSAIRTSAPMSQRLLAAIVGGVAGSPGRQGSRTGSNGP